MTSSEQAPAVDWGRSGVSDDYARHRAGFPDDAIEDLRAIGLAAAGDRVADLGAGTGNLTRLLAAAGCEAIGVDIAEPMLETARRLADRQGLAISFQVAPAEATGLAAGWFDGVTAGQCWHWFDRPAAAAEAMRLLRPGGWIAMVHFDWLPLANSMVAATERLILEHNPDWAGAGGEGLHPRWLTDLREAGFVDVVSRSRDVEVPYSHADWRGRIRASAGVAASLDADRVAAFDATLADLLRARGESDPMRVPHRLFVAAARKPA